MSEFTPKIEQRESSPGTWDDIETITEYEPDHIVAIELTSPEERAKSVGEARDAVADVFEKEQVIETGDSVLQDLIDKTGPDSAVVGSYLKEKFKVLVQLPEFRAMADGLKESSLGSLPELLQAEERNEDEAESVSVLLDLLLQRKEV